MSPRNSSGTMSATNGPYTSGTTIVSAQINARFADEEAELSDSLSRSGKGPMLSQLRNVDGTVAAPAVAFVSEPASGMYRAGTGDLRLAVGGVDALHLAAGGVIGPLTLPGGTTAIQVTLPSGFLLLQGNLNATDATNADTVLSSTATRTAGYLAAVQNPVGISKLLIDYQGLLRLNNAAALQPASIWTAITPGTGWTAGGGLAFAKDACGVVRVKGTVVMGAGAAGVCFTLPVGFRPAATRFFAIVDNVATGQGSVATNGDFVINSVTTVGHTYGVDNVTFLAEA